MTKITIKTITLFFFALMMSFIASAGSQAKFSLTPTTPTSVNFFGNMPTSATVSYLVTNNTLIARTLTMVPITGITQQVSPGTCANPFTLQAGFSCMLTLSLNPLTLPDSVAGGPEICKTMGPGNNAPDPFLCSQACGASALTINNFKLLFITISPLNRTVNPGATLQYTATAHFSNGGTQNVTTLVTWSSSSPTTATISNTSGSQGLATAISPGSTTITANLNGTTASTTLTVATPIIVVTPANRTINHGSTLQYTATELFPDGTTFDVTNAATWTSSNTTIATMSGTTQGLAIAGSPGTTTITATLGSISGNTTLTVANELLYVVNQGNSTVAICPLDPITGNFVSACVDSGAGAIFGAGATGIAINAAGTLAFVSSATEVTHCTINNNGTGTFSNCASQTITTPTPTPVVPMVNGAGLAITSTVTSTGTGIYITDRNIANPTLSRIILCPFNSSTGALNVGSCANAGATSLNQAYDITLNNAGTLAFITNQGDSRVTRCLVTAASGILTSCSNPIGATFLSTPQGLTLDPASTILYVVNTGGSPAVSKCPSATIPCTDSLASPAAVTSGMTYNTEGTAVYMSNTAAVGGTITKCVVDGSNNFTPCNDLGPINGTTSAPQLLTTR